MPTNASGQKRRLISSTTALKTAKVALKRRKRSARQWKRSRSKACTPASRYRRRGRLPISRWGRASTASRAAATTPSACGRTSRPTRGVPRPCRRGDSDDRAPRQRNGRVRADRRPVPARRGDQIIVELAWRHQRRRAKDIIKQAPRSCRCNLVESRPGARSGRRCSSAYDAPELPSDTDVRPEEIPSTDRSGDRARFLPPPRHAGGYRQAISGRARPALDEATTSPQ